MWSTRIKACRRKPYLGPRPSFVSFQFDAGCGEQLRQPPVRLLVLAVLGVALASPGMAQYGAPPSASQSGRPDRAPGLDAPAAPDPMSRAEEERLNIKRINERQKTIVADTTKLLQLAQELKEEVDKSTKDQLSISVVKKAEEVEKLAKAVKEKMKGF